MREESMKVDSRAGSNELIAPLLRLGVPVESATLPAGDVEVMGIGPEGRPVLVGIEVKKLNDVLTCMRDGRFSEQLRGMSNYFEVKWLLIEGRLRGMDNIMEIAHKNKWRKDGHYRYQEFVSWLQTMCIRGGVLLWRTENQDETVAWLRSLWVWWTSKEYETHRAHLDYYRPELLGGVTPFEPPTLVQKVAACLPGIAGKRSKAISAHFSSVHDMTCADVEEWGSIPGVGKKGAKKIVDALGGS
jgi:ERCC4-type nuclease